ncbi:MAG: aminopeptidase P family protein [Rhodospirillaceae bacterium]|jgi:Xaa-Pro aminopeptidase|nr:aminopeptidase P family protein [Rhodospirillaceae bacterium]MBT3808036.1 aminopeptidase P family protein [Rhodospirillaceae bacterium]MBT3932121.1 aminopeptidase P family protein [Rhodospirillaceae bacterium]MBT4774001.1 aminopeptidase P family protein [Rhodospirillaceae bacterium]MBT5358564.1 aminopeptidase P family protein [Rhodospirillaceae bacterium]
MNAKSPSQRLSALRDKIAEQGLDGFVVPHSDAHQNEFLPPDAERLSWLTGFTGSAGTAVVLADRAAMFVDGRYTLQVRDQVDGALYEFHHLIEAPVADWLGGVLRQGMRLGVDPWLHTQAGVQRLRNSAEAAGVALILVETNPVDAVWDDQPPPPSAPAVPHDEQFAGRSSAHKRRSLGEALAQEELDAAVLTQPDSIAWLLNVRGGDVAHTPLALSFAILDADGTVDWFVAPEKRSDALIAHLGSEVEMRDPEAFAGALDGLKDRRVLVAPDSAAAWIFDRLTRAGAVVLRGNDPVTLSKAIKNETELAGTRAAHLRDGAALSRFLHWLSEVAPSGDVDELSAAARLLEFRETGEHFRDLSFGTISGAGPNGAIVHYRVTPETNRALAPGDLYLVDSGAQYLDGTTDVTRTVAVGTPSDEMRDRFTRVLKGHIAIATARFPAGTSGAQLDSYARQALWQVGLDFDHGTGHGVGSYLGVHEGPQRIAKTGSSIPLQPGMIVSNEPGYYKEGAFGIRIENLLAVTQPGDISGGERPMLGFETLTLAPIDRSLITSSLLTADERAWMNAYHARVAAEIGPMLDGDALAWLAEVTRPLDSN